MYTQKALCPYFLKEKRVRRSPACMRTTSVSSLEAGWALEVEGGAGAGVEARVSLAVPLELSA